MTGWNLPPGCTNRDIDEAAGIREEEIYQEFANGNLSYLDAIQRLENLGYAPKEAEQVISEWADELSAQQRAAQREADHIDGYDRDDLGESPDF